MWLWDSVKPADSKNATDSSMMLPMPKAMFPTKPNRENMLVLLWFPAFSAISALLEAENAPSAIPSISAAISRIARFVVNANSAITPLATTLPIM